MTELKRVAFIVPGEPQSFDVKEVWKPVSGFEGEYEVSNLGRVRSLDRIQHRSNGHVECDFHIKGCLVKPYITGKGNGYYTVSIKHKNIKVHRLVADAFLPQVEGKNEVNHINGNKHDNRASNLEWTTGVENIRHAFKMGLMYTGETVHNAKLTASDVISIRKMYKKGDANYGAKPLSRKFGVSNTTIRKIVNWKKWRYEEYE